MTSWKTGLTVALTLGLANAPLSVLAHDEGSEKGEHKAHHGTTDGHSHEGTKKEVKAQGEAKKADTAAEGTSAAHHEGHGASEGDKEMEEGSH
ncbi:MAG: hypothetical protein HYZ72_13325 [Deltaproteobacteria bacterium]|nr:hypothetical protein [Deltaproteobacteria bacterium]